MKPVAFDYCRPATLREAISSLQQGHGSAKVIAGGQSLGPMLNLRLARPKLLVDIGRIPELKLIDLTTKRLSIGAGVTHAEIEDGILTDKAPGLMQSVASGIAYRAVRNRGTIGGSISHADPAADWILTMTALEASVQIAGPKRRRAVPLTAFMKSAYTTVLEDDEIVVAVDVIRLSAGTRWTHRKLSRKVGKFADAAVVVVIDPDSGFASVTIGRPEGAPLSLSVLAQRLKHAARVAPSIEEIAESLDQQAGWQEPYERHIQIAILGEALNEIATS
jgi:aerobic carbon-monoxide dehydrogenase medium subunit